MNMISPVEHALAGQSSSARAEELLRRYPEIAADETAELLRFLTKGPILEVGVISGRADLQQKLHQLRADHAASFRMNAREYAVFTLIVAVFLAMCALLWNVGVK
jgi:hypothetical protein